MKKKHEVVDEICWKHFHFLEQNKILRKENAQAWMDIVLSRYPSAKVLFIEENPESIYLLGFEFSDFPENDDFLSFV